MVRKIVLPSLGACAVLLAGCVQPQDGYGYRYGYGAPAQPAHAAAVQEAKPAAPQPEESLLALAPLNLPIREDWSSAKCPDLAVTFSGRSQPAHSVPSDDASFQEERQYHEAAYYEVAECFCAKGGDLSQTTKAAAEAVTAQTAQQFSDSAHMRIRSAAFVENGPLGKYSEIEATPLAQSTGVPSVEVVTLRTYWRGQCSMRVETMASPETRLRAAQFLGSLRAIKLATAQRAEAAPAPDAAEPAKPEVEPGAPAALPPGTAIAPPPPAAEGDAPH
ncbi:MAG TPA: hypothetical protein VN802_01145 [Stellaceae bacterium]|nr:hypothetical protein [Stellaceae bacterium]